METLYNADCLEKMKDIPDKSVQLITFDPPYNINKADWDTIPDYLAWLFTAVASFERILKDNGSFFLFHNDMETIADILVRMRTTRFRFRQMIVWNKRFPTARNKGFLDGYVMRSSAHNWEKMCEYILFFTFDNTYKLKEAREKLKVSAMTISNEIRSKTGGLTGWYSNIELGKNLPTRETIKPITKHLNLTYDDIVPKFHTQRKHHSVWDIEIARSSHHETPKPEELYKQLILHTTDEGDVVLDPTFGTGSSGRACAELKRNYIGIEKNKDFFEKY